MASLEARDVGDLIQVIYKRFVIAASPVRIHARCTWLRDLLSLLEISVCLDRRPIYQRPKDVGILFLPAPESSLKAFLFGEKIQGLLQCFLLLEILDLPEREADHFRYHGGGCRDAKSSVEDYPALVIVLCTPRVSANSPLPSTSEDTGIRSTIGRSSSRPLHNLLGGRK